MHVSGFHALGIFVVVPRSCSCSACLCDARSVRHLVELGPIHSVRVLLHFLALFMLGRPGFASVSFECSFWMSGREHRAAGECESCGCDRHERSY
ncbi:hypothetical protein DFP72DRAFT_886836 [Ephemerocybe angulata]|uniref:Secreted protein n=1 Tax=Ephemerocybe angulata TaxID=980116 RepID=A0A8H6I6N0_9AGAR|nr:hypothetical protein DFP72DRAFT_886836 [Tulosesus angulatus]